MKQKIFNIGSLFAGIGGFDLGLETASDYFKASVANEKDANACKTYRANFNHTLVEGDIQLILEPDRLEWQREQLKARQSELSARPIKKIVKSAMSKLSTDVVDKITKDDFEVPASSVKDFTNHVEYKVIERELNALHPDKVVKLMGEYEEKKEQMLAEPVDILTGGFPCQSFSIAGDRKGTKDYRGDLFFSIIKYIQLLRERHYAPRFLLLENVKNLLSHDEGETIKDIIAALGDEGYFVDIQLMNTTKHSYIPHNRARVYIIGFRDEEDYRAWQQSAPFEEFPTDPIIPYLEDKVEDKYHYTKEKYPKLFSSPVDLSKDVTEKGYIYQLRRVYVRQNMNRVCPTLTANCGSGGHNVPLVFHKDVIRKLTPRECFRLQGFPDFFIHPKLADSHLYKQAGNAVTVDVVRLIGQKLVKIIEGVK